MSDTEEPFSLDGFIRDHLHDGLIYVDRMELPPWDAAYATNAELEAGHAQFYAAMNGFHLHAVIAHVLIRLRERDATLAETLAAELKSYLDAGDAYPEWVWDWAEAAGLEPEKVQSDSRAKHAQWLTEPTRHAKRLAAEREAHTDTDTEAAPAAGTSN